MATRFYGTDDWVVVYLTWLPGSMARMTGLLLTLHGYQALYGTDDWVVVYLTWLPGSMARMTGLLFTLHGYQALWHG